MARSVAREHLHVVVRAGRRESNLGACPSCARVLLVLALKAEGGALTYTVTPILPARPPPELRGALVSEKLPALLLSG